jgi:hypothetical protein
MSVILSPRDSVLSPRDSVLHSEPLGGFEIPPESEEDARFMPKQSLRVGCLQKKSINTKGIVWTKRRVMLTEDELMFARVEDPERRLLDYIALEDIVEVNCARHACRELLSVSQRGNTIRSRPPEPEPNALACTKCSAN